MKKGVLIIIILGIIFVVGVAVVRPLIFNRTQRSTSDAHSETKTIRFGGDSYLGYWFINSPEMKIQSPRKGFTVDFTDDGGAYADRLQKFAEKKYDCIVLPINSYLEHGAKHKFPGVIAAGVCESKDADAIVGFGDVLPSGKINDLNNRDFKWTYVGQSPSSFLADLTISDFGLDELQADKSWRKEVGSIEEVYKLAKAATKDRSVGDIFILWEPYASKAVNELGMKYLWGSDKFAGYIIDVFVFNRDFVRRNPELVKNFLSTYFRVMERYSLDKQKLVKEMSKSTGYKSAMIETMLGKIDWFDLSENCGELFGIQVGSGVNAEEKIVSSIVQCATVLERSGNFDQGNLSDPYLILNSDFLKDMSKTALRSVGSSGQAQAANFSQQSDEDWAKTKEVGAMRVEPISFQQGTNNLDESGKAVVDKVAALLINNYPGYRVAVRGHTGPGDEEANAKLSLERAQVVMQRLVGVHNINSNRLHAEGLGSKQPPKAKPGESDRTLRFRMARVEFVLLEGNTL